MVIWSMDGRIKWSVVPAEVRNGVCSMQRKHLLKRTERIPLLSTCLDFLVLYALCSVVIFCRGAVFVPSC